MRKKTKDKILKAIMKILGAYLFLSMFCFDSLTDIQIRLCFAAWIIVGVFCYVNKEILERM